MSLGNEWSGPDELSLERGDLCYGYQFLWNFASDKRLRTRLFDALYWDLYDKETWDSGSSHVNRWYQAQRRFWELYEAPSNKEWDWDTIPIPDTFECIIQRRHTARRNIEGEYADTLDPLSQHAVEEDSEQTPERDLIAALLHEVQCLKQKARVGKVWDAVVYRRELPLGPQIWNRYDQDLIEDKGLDYDDGDNGYTESYEQSNPGDGNNEYSTEHCEGETDEYACGYTDEYAELYEESNIEEGDIEYGTEYYEGDVDEYASGYSDGYAESYEESNLEDAEIEYSTEYYDEEIDEYASGYVNGSDWHASVQPQPQPQYENDENLYHRYTNDEETGLPRNTQHIIDSDPEPADTMTITTRCRNVLFLRGTSRFLNPRNEGGAHAKRRDLFMIEYLSGAGIILNEPNQYGIVYVHIKGSRDARDCARYYLDDYVRCLHLHEDAHRESNVEVLNQWDDHRGVGEY